MSAKSLFDPGQIEKKGPDDVINLHLPPLGTLEDGLSFVLLASRIRTRASLFMFKYHSNFLSYGFT